MNIWLNWINCVKLATPLLGYPASYPAFHTTSRPVSHLASSSNLLCTRHLMRSLSHVFTCCIPQEWSTAAPSHSIRYWSLCLLRVYLGYHLAVTLHSCNWDHPLQKLTRFQHSELNNICCGVAYLLTVVKGHRPLSTLPGWNPKLIRQLSTLIVAPVSTSHTLYLTTNTP